MQWVFLDANSGGDDFTLRQLRLTLLRQKHSVESIKIIDGQKLKTPDEIKKNLSKLKPDRILWCSIAGIPYCEEIWTQPPWDSIPKIILWFDEPVTGIEHYELTDRVKQIAARKDFFFGIWDGYWRDEAKKLWNMSSHAIHLSADEEEYRPTQGSLKIPSSDEAIFIGMLHSAKSVEERIEALPSGMKILAKAVQSKLSEEISSAQRGDPTRLIPCGKVLWEETEKNLRPKEKIVIQTECQRDPVSVKYLRWCIWAMAKNAFRIQILRKTLQVSPLRIFCEQKQQLHASEAEWRQLLSEQGSRLQIVDTSQWKSEDLGKLYHYGSIQIQATDPQSVQGGIPYRVFQTAACGRTLLTDLRPELIECFEPGKEILGYNTASDFTSALNDALSNKEKLQEIGKASRSRFEKEHLWKHRLATIESWIK